MVLTGGDIVTTLYVGIDPGRNGGIAVLTAKGEVVSAIKLPGTRRELLNIVTAVTLGGKNRVALEKVGGYVQRKGDNGDVARGSHMFVFGKGVGWIEMALEACGLAFREITPQQWQKGLGIPPRKKHDKVRSRTLTKGRRKGTVVQEKWGGETDREFKARLRAVAEKLFPGVKLTNATSDAILLAEFMRRSES